MKQFIWKVRIFIIFLFVLVLTLILEFPTGIVGKGLFIGDAQAVIGRPRSPTSVAGVARRTTRRTVRRQRHLTTLPRGCVKVIRRGVTYHQCSGVYYRPAYQGNQLVYEEVQNP